MLNVVAGERAEILLIDDDALALASAAAALESAGHIVYEARDRLAALRTARSRALDLIICDLSVAGESGLEICRELRRLPGMPDVPVMFVSRTQLPDIVRRSHEAGAAYFLRKPLDPEVLVDLVGKALWMPHLVRSRLSMHERAAQPMPPPQAKRSARQAAVQGIRLPLA
jgi:two-component system chemotaxis response regulator CheY